MSFRILKDSRVDALVGDKDALFNHNERIRGDLNVEGKTNLQTIETATLSLNDMLLPPPCVQPKTQGSLWVSDPNATAVAPPLVTTKPQDSLRYQDSSCRDNIVQTTPTDPFHGWWVSSLKGAFQLNINDQLIFIDTTKSPIEITCYPGNADSFRQPAPSEISGTGINKFARIDQNTIQLLGILNPPDKFLVSFRLQANKNIMAGFSNLPTYAQGGAEYYLFYKLPTNPTIRPYGLAEFAWPGGNSYSNASNPVFMFDEFCDFQLSEQPMTTLAVGYTEYPGYQAYTNYQQRLKTTGVGPFNTTIAKVQRTVVGGKVSLNAPLVPTRFLTVIYTNVQHHASPFTSVTLSGFSGIYTLLNGTFKVTTYENRLFYDDNATFINPSTVKYRFCIELDTSSLPADTNGYVTGLSGTELASVSIGPITPASEYKDLLAAQYEMFYYGFKFSTHSRIRYYTPSTDPLYCIETFSALQTRLRAGTAVSRNDQTNLRVATCGSINYVNTSTSPLANQYPNRSNAPINNPFGMIPTLSSNIFAYNIPLENYLDFTPGFEPRNIWWRLTGTAVTSWQQYAGQTYYGDPTTGQTFEAITWPVKAGVPPPFGSGKPYFQLGNPVSNNYSATIADRYLFGRINPSFVSGNNIGYLKTNDSSWQDPQSLMLFLDFAPKPPAFPVDTTLLNPAANIQAACRVWSEGMKYIITTLGCQNKIIYDNRGNNGGTPAIPLLMASFFGGDRKGGEFQTPLADSGFGNPIDIGTYDIYMDAVNKFYEFGFNILPSKNQLYYPGSVLQNSGARVYLLHSVGASSAGDTVPHMFLGDNLDKNLGSGVTAKIFGDVNGILAGGTGNTLNQTTSAISFPVTVNTTFTGTISGVILTVTSSVTNGPLVLNQLITGTGVAANTYVIGYVTGSGSAGTYTVSTSQVVPSTVMTVSNVPVPFNRLTFENCSAFLRKMKAEPNSMANRGIWLKPDTPLPAVNYLGAGPWPNSHEDNYYQDLGAPGATFPVPKLPGDARANPNLLPQWPAQPTVGDRALWRDRWLEQTVYDAIQP